jgi:hypothetical protein
MNVDRLIENIIDQIKEAQLKLGYAKEIIRLYFPVTSLMRLLEIDEGECAQMSKASKVVREDGASQDKLENESETKQSMQADNVRNNYAMSEANTQNGYTIKLCNQEDDYGWLIDELSSDSRLCDGVLGHLEFSISDKRVEIMVPWEGVTYVHQHVPEPEFLKKIIELFSQNHHLKIEEICSCFQATGKQYICKEMEPGTDFDYVLYFPDKVPDAWYYCVKMEMGHTIYHRFSEGDYLELIR